ncbi:MAG: ribose 5-phosphate isomerase B [bacterium]|nr:ribose 5-phosphate isomerase B [bacterium]
MKIAFGSDHRGFALRNALIKYVTEKGYGVKDFGPDDDASCDYVDFARAAAEAVAGGDADFGVLICGSGIGMSIAANKVPGIRAALVFDRHAAGMTRRHNDANVLCLSGDAVAEAMAQDILDIFLSTEFEGGRHARRVGKITDIEGDYNR